MDEIEQTNYEQQDPGHRTEDEFVDQTRRRLDKSLRKIDELTSRMAKNAGRTSPEKTAE